MSDELKPCPFCGGRAELYGSWQDSWIVECTKCHASTNDYKENFDAIFAWNTRADDAPETTVNNAQADSRERLEADCEKLIGNIQRRIFSGRDAGALRCQLKELLDRQAAIDRKEFETTLEGIQECMRNGGR